ncbi:hypothetical protein KEM52_005064, partial [Ascosphaera acerosa]
LEDSGSVDAGALAGLLAGLTSRLTLAVLRGWDAARPVLVVPGMSVMEWRSAITRRQLDALHALWEDVRVLPPLLTRWEEARGVYDPVMYVDDDSCIHPPRVRVRVRVGVRLCARAVRGI